VTGADDLATRIAKTKARLDANKAAKAAAASSGGGDQTDSASTASSPLSPPLARKKVRRQSEKDEERILPHSIEAEQGVISSILQDCQRGQRVVLNDVSQKINENFFYVPAHRTIYEMIVSLWRADRPIDLIGFTQFLQSKHMLAQIGGAGALTEVHGYVDKLTQLVPTPEAIEYYLSIVREKFARREIIADAKYLIKKAFSDDVDQFTVRVQRIANRMTHIGASTNGRLPVLCDTAEFFATDDPPLPEQVIYNVLHRGSKMLIGGSSKGRKTWALLDLAISVACGVDWWGFHTRKGAVCYLNLELQDAFFRWRAKTVCATKNVQPEHGMLFAWNLRGHAKPMQQLVAELIGSLKQHHFSLIIIDPIYKTLPAFRGSENDSAMITQLLNEVEAIAVETGAAVLFCSHFSKGDQSEKESVDRISGSGAWARDPDSLLTMTAHEENECYSVEGTLRNMTPIYPFVVKWEFPLFVRQDELNADRLRKRGPKGEPPEKLLAMLSEFNGQEPKDVLKQMNDQHDIKRRTVYRMKAILEERGLMKTQDGLWFKC